MPPASSPSSSLAAMGLDLTPLLRNCLFRSDIRRETYNSVASELCDYRLRWSGSAVDARGYRARTEKLAIYLIKYGDEVTITPQLYSDFMLAHLCLRKGIEVCADRDTIFVPEGGVYFSFPKRAITLRWQQDCEQILVRIPLSLVRQPCQRIGDASGLLLSPTMVRLFVNQLNMVLAMSHHSEAAPDLHPWVAHAEKTLADFVRLHLVGSSRRSNGARQGEGGGSDRRERLEGLIQSRLAEPIELDDLTNATGLGRSQLNALCQTSFGCSPMQLVRLRRLQSIRSDLERDPTQDLTTLALSHGFDHQGRFARYYRNAFGELPRETRRKLR